MPTAAAAAAASSSIPDNANPTVHPQITTAPMLLSCARQLDDDNRNNYCHHHSTTSNTGVALTDSYRLMLRLLAPSAAAALQEQSPD
jgi:hypothetical protein